MLVSHWPALIGARQLLTRACRGAGVARNGSGPRGVSRRGGWACGRWGRGGGHLPTHKKSHGHKYAVKKSQTQTCFLLFYPYWCKQIKRLQEPFSTFRDGHFVWFPTFLAFHWFIHLLHQGHEGNVANLLACAGAGSARSSVWEEFMVACSFPWYFRLPCYQLLKRSCPGEKFQVRNL